MRRLLYASAVLALIISALFQTRVAGQTAGRAASAPAVNPHQALVDTYCIGCHNSRAKGGGLALGGLDLQAAAGNAAVWGKALRKLRGHLMPPPGSAQPEQKDVDAFVGWMENTLDTHATGPNAGHVPLQRLNRTEYVASVKALVGVELKATDVLPQDGQVDGFDNIAAALTVSPAFLSQYITAARQVAKLAIGNPNPLSRVRNTPSPPTPTLTSRCRSARVAASASSTTSRPTANTASPSTTWEWASITPRSRIRA